MKAKLDEISLLLVMTDGSDTIGVEALAALLGELKDCLAKSELPPDIAQSVAALIAKQPTIPGPEFVSQVSAFVSQFQAFLENVGSVTFAPKKQTDAERGDNFDSSFLAEFLEKHTLMLDEFEGDLAEFRFKETPTTEEVADIRQFARKYLHNIKGDAGSIGLRGIEHVTHILEDVSETLEITSLIDSLLSYREWLRGAFQALTKGSPFPESSTDFEKRLQLIGAAATVSQTISAASPSSPVAPVASGNEEIPATYTISVEKDLFSEFRSEAEDHLTNVEALLLDKGAQIEGSDVDTVFRGVHSLKGASSYFNLVEMNKTSHDLENILDQARSGKRTFDSALASLVLTWVDLQKSFMKSANNAFGNNGLVTSIPQSVEFLHRVRAYGRAEQVRVETPVPVEVEASASKTEEIEVREVIGEKVGVKTFVKVDTVRLDRLIESIGEMVIYSSMLIRSCREHLGDNEHVIQTTDQVEKFSRELQDIGMSMRLDPIRGLFQKMSRLVWDMSRRLKKDIQFNMRGEDTELDRTVIEKLADPLMHMVRNALDHGIEDPEERARKGKSRKGNIELSAAHAGGSIIVTIVDDGRGLDPEKLIKKAKERGVISPDAVLTREEAFQLIFAPGLSTAQAVTDISGRGVGMDVVRNNIQSMRGQIRIESEVNIGTTFTIELPLTLAIIDGVETIVGNERFIFPTLSVLEFMNPEPEMFSRTVGRGETFYFRGNFLPVYRLGRLFELEAKSNDSRHGIVVIADCGKEHVALVVDDIIGSCQTVIKRLGDLFPESHGVAGCAIMPNGDIGLILDVRSLVQLARRDYVPTLKENSGENQHGAVFH